METSQPSFPQMHQPRRQAYVFLCLIRGNVKMTPSDSQTVLNNIYSHDIAARRLTDATTNET